MSKVRKKKMLIALGILLITVGVVVIWFSIPYSPIKNQFQNDITALLAENQLSFDNEVFSQKDFAHLPATIQKYVENCGYIGTPKMSYRKMEYRDVVFLQNKNGPALKINYTQYSFANDPCRMALIDSSMFGIPFEGYDYYQNGIGGMKGVIAKAVTLFDQKGLDMDKACLATFLAESLFVPTILLQDYITLEEINAFEVRATINYKGQMASGIFTFNEQYEMIRFTTNDRAVVETDGHIEYIPWTAQCSNYELLENGIKCPTKFQAIWNYPDAGFVYFDGVISEIE